MMPVKDNLNPHKEWELMLADAKVGDIILATPIVCSKISAVVFNLEQSILYNAGLSLLLLCLYFFLIWINTHVEIEREKYKFVINKYLDFHISGFIFRILYK